MRFSWCKSSVMKNGQAMGAYNEEMFRRDFEKAMKDGHNYGVSLKKGKRFRSAFTTEQVKYLEKEFRKYPYIGNARRKDVANVLNIPERAVKIWFQNRRMKEKKDSTNKESDDKTTEASNDELPTVPVLQSTNDASLPLLTVSDDSSANSEIDRTMEQNKLQTKESKFVNYYKDISSEADILQELKVKVSTPDIRNNVVSTTTTTAEYSIELFKKYKSEREDTEDVKMLDREIKHNRHQVKQHSPFSHMTYKCESQLPSYPPYVPATVSSQGPQDLSSKQNLSSPTLKTFSTQQNTEEKFNASDVPLYLKGFYAQPYIPPGNMLWKPINVAPIMSAPIPTAAVPNPGLGGQHQSTIKRSCSCDCHIKSHNTSVIFHQNNPSPNLQYVIAAVPFQNHSPKF